MSGFAFFVGGVLPYVAVIVFVVAFACRIRSWAKAPQPGSMTLFPAKGSSTRGVLAEALFFPSLFKGDRVLWFFAWVFHVTLALVFLGHLRVVTGLIDSSLMAMGMSEEGIHTMSSTVGGAAGVVLLATGLILLIRRLVVTTARQASGVPDFFALLLLIAIVITGNAMRFGAHFDLAQTHAWAYSLLVFSPVVPENGMFLAHSLLGWTLFVYIPFSKILHFGGIFFTHALVKGR